MGCACHEGGNRCRKAWRRTRNGLWARTPWLARSQGWTLGGEERNGRCSHRQKRTEIVAMRPPIGPPKIGRFSGNNVHVTLASSPMTAAKPAARPARVSRSRGCSRSGRGPARLATLFSRRKALNFPRSFQKHSDDDSICTRTVSHALRMQKEGSRVEIDTYSVAQSRDLGSQPRVSISRSGIIQAVKTCRWHGGDSSILYQW